MKATRGSRRTYRSSAAGEADARARLERLFIRFDRLIPDDLAHVGLDAGRAAARSEARVITTRALRTAGLAALATEARDAARDRLLERWTGAAYRPTWAGGLNWGVSSGRAEDRAAVVAALEDAALAAVAEGIAPDDVVAALGGDGDAILGMATGGPAEESLAAAVHVAAVADSRLAGAGLVIFLVLIVAPTLLVAGTVAASVGELGVVSVSTGALVLVGSVAVLVVRRARRAIGNQSDAG